MCAVQYRIFTLIIYYIIQVTTVYLYIQHCKLAVMADKIMEVTFPHISQVTATNPFYQDGACYSSAASNEVTELREQLKQQTLQVQSLTTLVQQDRASKISYSKSKSRKSVLQPAPEPKS